MEQRKNIHSNYLVLNGKSEELEHYSIKMILEQSIPNILSLEIQRLDNDGTYYYDITGLQTIKEFINKRLLSRELVEKLLYSILKQLQITKEYLLDEDNLLLTIDSIFIEPISQSIYFCYQYNYNQDVKKQIEDLIEYFLEHVDYEDKKAVLLVYDLYKISREDWNCQKMRDILDNFLGDDLSKNILSRSSTPIVEDDFALEIEASSFKEENISNFKVYDSNSKNEINRGNKMEATYHFEPMQESRKQYDGNLTHNTWKEENLTSNKLCQMNEIDDNTNKTYSFSVWIGCAASVLACLAILVYFTTSGFLFDKQTGEVYLPKMVLLFSIVGILEVVILNGLLKDKAEDSVCIEREDGINNTSKEDIRFAENCCRSDEEETIVLARKEEFYLSPFEKEIYQDIKILEFPFFVGKLKSKVDGMIESRTVSRYHARIDEENGCYYVTDLNSTNGTFLNGKKICSNEKFRIKLEDVITFANVEYKFIRK